MKDITQIVQKTADLARLELSGQELEMFSQQIANVLSYVDKLQKVDTNGVEPMVTPLVNKDGSSVSECYMRADEVKNGGGAAIVATAPEHLYDNYKVPQVIAGKS